MTILGSKYLFWAVVILAIAALILLFVNLHNRAQRHKSVAIALREYKAWGSGSVKETSPEKRAALSKYWQAANAPDYGYGAAWSAAFISYLFKEAGAGSRFPYASSHSVYIREAVKNRNAGKRFGLLAYTPDEYAPKVGDLVCYPRQSGVTFDTDHAYDSHCDIVVAVNRVAGQLITIGGNVSNSVTKTVYPINASGQVTASKVHAILSNPL